MLLDVGGGTGIYAIAYLQLYTELRAIVWDRPEVLKVARELAESHGVADRLQCVPGDMFADPVPPGADVMLLSNILHDWDEPECRVLVNRLATALPGDGRLLIHDVYLHDTMDGPLPIALYSAALFTLTEGRAYSAAEYRRGFAMRGWSRRRSCRRWFIVACCRPGKHDPHREIGSSDLVRRRHIALLSERERASRPTLPVCLRFGFFRSPSGGSAQPP